MNWYFITASGLLGLHNYAALMARGQRLKWIWHLVQWSCVGLYVCSGVSGLWDYLYGANLWILFGVNILFGSIVYNIILHGLKYINFKIPKWFMR